MWFYEKDLCKQRYDKIIEHTPDMFSQNMLDE